MKLNKVFKVIELANELKTTSNKSNLSCAYLWIDNKCYGEFTTMKEITKVVKKEFLPQFATALLNTDYVLCSDCIIRA